MLPPPPPMISGASAEGSFFGRWREKISFGSDVSMFRRLAQTLFWRYSFGDSACMCVPAAGKRRRA